MREIKFKCWDIDNKKMWNCAVPLLSPASNGGVINVSDNEDGSFNSLVKNGALFQFTGLKDKNGIDIYEGDIVKFKSFHDDSYWTREVTYSRAAFYADYRLEDLVAVKDVFSVEVIGNIHQNPELLKQ